MVRSLLQLPLLTHTSALQWGNAGREAALGVYLTERLDAARSLSRLLALQVYHQLQVGEAGEAEGTNAVAVPTVHS